MTKEVLDKYRFRVKEIERLKKKIRDLEGSKGSMVAGRVKTSMQNFPYSQCSSTIMMDDAVGNAKIDKKIMQCREEIEELEQLNDDSEAFIYGIDDPLIKTVFEFRYIDGNDRVSQNKVADYVGFDRSSISKMINKYIKLSQ